MSCSTPSARTWFTNRPTGRDAATAPWSEWRIRPLAGTEALLAQFSDQVIEARKRYARFVAQGLGAATPWEQLKGQSYLGDEEFVRQMQANIETVGTDINIPKRQRRRPALSLEQLANQHADRNQAILTAYRTGQHSYQEIGEFFGLHFTTVGQIVRKGTK